MNLTLPRGESKVQGIRVAAPRSHSLEELRCHLCLPGSEPTFLPHSAPSSQWALVSGSASPPPNGLSRRCRADMRVALQYADWAGDLKMESLVFINSGPLPLITAMLDQV